MQPLRKSVEEQVPVAETYQFRDLPLTPGVIGHLLLEERRSGRVPDTFSRSDVLPRLMSLHVSRGGRNFSAKGSFKKALAGLRERGLVEQPSKQAWRFIEAVASDESSAVMVTAEIAVPAPLTDATQQSPLVIEEEIGTGVEAVYVYYQPNDRELARLRGVDVWECKVGMTRGPVDTRVLDQLSPTSIHTLPTVGLVVRSDDAASLERLLHSILNRSGSACRRSGTGSEWFLTSPARIKDLIIRLNAMIESLRPPEVARDR